MNYSDIYYGSSNGTESLDALTSLFNLGFGFTVISSILSIAYSVFIIICNWKLFQKAGKAGWKSLIPIYNIIVLFQIAELPWWYLLLYLIPFVNIYVVFKYNIELAKRFGKDTGFGILMTFFNPICLPILALGKSTYRSKNSTYENSSFNNQMQSYSMPQQPVNNSTYIMGAPQPVNNVYVKSFCPNCGSKLERGNSFCTMCGEKL